MNEKTALIASASTSAEEYVPIVKQLKASGFDVVVYNSDEVLQGGEAFLFDKKNNCNN
jgi:hypothetical protein